MKSATHATIEDLYRVPEHGKAEIVDGELVLMSPSGGLHGLAAGAIFASLREHQRRAGGGYAYPDNVGFIVKLPHRLSFSPDAAFHNGPRPSAKFVDGAPVFAVEVRSENDYTPAAEAKLAKKRADYFAAGTLVVWDVDLQSPDVVRSYAPGDPRPTVYMRGQIAQAEPAVPGWRFPVDELFE